MRSYSLAGNYSDCLYRTIIGKLAAIKWVHKFVLSHVLETGMYLELVLKGIQRQFASATRKIPINKLEGEEPRAAVFHSIFLKSDWLLTMSTESSDGVKRSSMNNYS